MARLFSLVTFFVLATLEVCTALKPQAGTRLYRITLRGLYLQPKEMDRPVHFVRDIQHEHSSVWEVSSVDNRRVTIRHPQLNGYLSYIDAYSGAVLMLQTRPRYWILNGVEHSKGEMVKIQSSEQYEGKALVIEEHQIHVSPPLAGLGFSRKDDGQALELECVDRGLLRHNVQSRTVSDGTYFLRSGEQYLVPSDEHDSLVRLSHYPVAMWVVRHEGNNQYTIRKSDHTLGSLLYLGYHRAAPSEILHLQEQPQYWTLNEIRETVFEIQTAEEYRGQSLNIARLEFTNLPLFGLELPRKDCKHQEWRLTTW